MKKRFIGALISSYIFLLSVKLVYLLLAPILWNKQILFDLNWLLNPVEIWIIPLFIIAWIFKTNIGVKYGRKK